MKLNNVLKSLMSSMFLNHALVCSVNVAKINGLFYLSLLFFEGGSLP